MTGAGSAIVNNVYALRAFTSIPAAFARVCVASSWDASATWASLNGERAWWESPNSSYMYFNLGDRRWWLDSGETGLGLYVSTASGVGDAPPCDGWSALGDGALPLPTVTVVDDAGGELCEEHNA